jgi:hypothetical protein
MVNTKKMWGEKRLAREERSDSEDTDRDNSGEENNMVFELPSEFCAPEREVVELALRAKGSLLRSWGNT